MAGKTIFITDADMKHLRELIFSCRSKDGEDERHLKELEEELGKAKVVESNEIPGDVITMYSKLHLEDLDSKTEIVCWLVFPKDADVFKNRISVLSPVGTALIGFKVGDVIKWNVPQGKRNLKVKEIMYQPESAGNFDVYDCPEWA